MRTPGWGRFAGHYVASEPVRGVVCCAELLTWSEHWAWGQARAHRERGCAWCLEKAKLRRRCAFAVRRQGWYGWLLVSGGVRLQGRFSGAFGSEPCYGAEIELWRDGGSANASLKVRMLGRAKWTNPNRDPVAWTDMAAQIKVIALEGWG